MKQLLIVILVCLFAIPVYAGEKETSYERVVRTGTIRCGYIGWKPYYYYNDVNDPSTRTGMNVDLMNEIGKVLGLKIEWTEEAGWGNIGEGLKAGRYDLICTSMWPDPPKYQNFLLSRPLYYSAIYPWVRNDDKRFDGHAEKINDPSVKIAVIDGGPSESMAKQFFPEASLAGVSPMAQSAEFYMMVTSGKADVINADVDEINAYLENNKGAFRVVEGIDPLQYYPHVMAVPSDSPQLNIMIDNALGFLIDNGFMDRIIDKYELELLAPQKGISSK